MWCTHNDFLPIMSKVWLCLIELHVAVNCWVAPSHCAKYITSENFTLSHWRLKSEETDSWIHVNTSMHLLQSNLQPLTIIMSFFKLLLLHHKKQKKKETKHHQERRTQMMKRLLLRILPHQSIKYLPRSVEENNDIFFIYQA